MSSSYLDSALKALSSAFQPSCLQKQRTETMETGLNLRAVECQAPDEVERLGRPGICQRIHR